MRYSHQLNELKHFWESEKKAALGELEAKTGAVIAELENLQQVYTHAVTLYRVRINSNHC